MESHDCEDIDIDNSRLSKDATYTSEIDEQSVWIFMN
jgi:hypothetical protein